MKVSSEVKLKFTAIKELAIANSKQYIYTFYIIT